MRPLRRLMPALFMLIAIVGCAGLLDGGGSARGAHARVRILLKKDGEVCKSRTIPKSHAVLKGEEDEIVWDIKVKDECLADADLVLKWVVSTKNPTKCPEISTATHGNKSRIRCDLLDDPAVGPGYEYKVYLRKGGMDTLIEDPDVEIVMF